MVILLGTNCLKLSVVSMHAQANAGDSRALACFYGNLQPLSHDHKPLDPSMLWML